MKYIVKITVIILAITMMFLLASCSLLNKEPQSLPSAQNPNSVVKRDFDLFESAFVRIATNKSGFNHYGWNSGDLNYNKFQEDTETWTDLWTLQHPNDKNDSSSFHELSEEINTYLEPTHYISIDKYGKVKIASGVKDPWNKEYQGYYMSNAIVDGKDCGVIIIVSCGENGVLESKFSVANGAVSVTERDGSDDLYMYVACVTGSENSIVSKNNLT